MINSEAADQTTATRPYNPTLEINLNQPIEKATSMQLMSFSTSNDFFNIRAGNNTFSCMLYTLSGTPSIERKTYTLDTGLFTIQEIVNTLNAKAAESPFGTMEPVFTLLASNKVQITCSSTGVQKRRFVLFSSIFFKILSCTDWDSISTRFLRVPFLPKLLLTLAISQARRSNL